MSSIPIKQCQFETKPSEAIKPLENIASEVEVKPKPQQSYQRIILIDFIEWYADLVFIEPAKLIDDILTYFEKPIIKYYDKLKDNIPTFEEQCPTYE